MLAGPHSKTLYMCHLATYFKNIFIFNMDREINAQLGLHSHLDRAHEGEESSRAYGVVNLQMTPLVERKTY